MNMFKIGVYGYGNLGRGVVTALKAAPDMEPTFIFTRRDPASIEADVPVHPADQVLDFKDKVDALILCGGSATDLPVQTPALVKDFTVVDSFDTHANIPAHFTAVHNAAIENGSIALISAGWDPGLFSLNRAYASAILPEGTDYTFWGKGVSQGHSDAVRRIAGVLDARQYTIPVPEALHAVQNGETPSLTTRQKHTRYCYVVAAEDADKAKIEKEICEMPNYFAEYDTTVEFISAEEMARDHSGLPHGGFVIRTGKTLDGTSHTISYSLKLASNPSFTASVLVAYTRALIRMRRAGETGCKTVLDVPPALLSPLSDEELRRTLL